MHVWASLYSFCAIHEWWSALCWGQNVNIKQHDEISSKTASVIGWQQGWQCTFFYCKFSKAFDCVPPQLLPEKFASIGVGVCFLEILYNYLFGREQFHRMNNCSSATVDFSSDIPQGSRFVLLLFCIFINDLLELLKFSEPIVFVDNLMLLFGKTEWQIQEHLNSIQQWVKTKQ